MPTYAESYFPLLVQIILAAVIAGALVFLSTFEGSLVVTARGQGQFALVNDHLRKNAWAGALLAPSPTVLSRIRARTTEMEAVTPAADVLDGKTIDEAAPHITAAWARTHAHP